MANVTKDQILRLVALYVKDIIEDSGNRDGDILITNMMDELGLLDGDYDSDEEENAAQENFMNELHKALDSLI